MSKSIEINFDKRSEEEFIVNFILECGTIEDIETFLFEKYKNDFEPMFFMKKYIKKSDKTRLLELIDSELHYLKYCIKRPSGMRRYVKFSYSCLKDFEQFLKNN